MKPLPDPPLVCLITTGETDSSNYSSRKKTIVDSIRDAVRDGVQVVQIREKRLPGRMLFDLVHDAVSVAERSKTAIFVNDRADVARSAGADGVHLPEAGLGPEVIKRVFPELLVGVSIHDLAGAVRASEAGADLIYFGPVFITPGKGEPVGIDMLRLVCREVAASVVALGGIDEGNFQTALEAGAAGIAAIRALNDAESRRRVLARLRAG